MDDSLSEWLDAECTAEENNPQIKETWKPHVCEVAVRINRRRFCKNDLTSDFIPVTVLDTLMINSA